MKLNCSKGSQRSFTDMQYPFRFTISIFCLLLIFAPSAWASSFSTIVSPPRFELEASPGEVIRDHIKISNAGDDFSNLVIRSADWDLDENAGVIIHPPALIPGSCRPWLRLERPKMRIPARMDRKFRFEIRVPEDQPAGECRVAILVEAAPEDNDMVSAGNVQFPVTGRIAVVVYVKVGDAQPALDVGKIEIRESNQRRIPMIGIHNLGLAHGRPEGLLEGKDSTGKNILLILSPLPVLPGETRYIPLWPKEADGSDLKSEIVPPIQLKGEIVWEGGKRKISQVLQ